MEQNESRPTITIKMKPHLQEYVRCKLNEEVPYVGLRIDLISTLIRPFIEMRPSDVPTMIQTGPEYITFKLPMYHDLNVRNGTAYISEKNQEIIERLLDMHFKDWLFSYLDDKVRYIRKNHTSKGAIQKCIIQFCSDNKIKFNDVTYETLRKAYYRRRTGIAKKSPFFSSILSHTSPLLFMI